MAEEHKNVNRAFQTIGVYFANAFWNRLYKNAVDLVKNGDIFDITESYKITVERYNRGFYRQENVDERINPQYTAVISDLKDYYEEQINRMRVIEEKPVSVHFSDRDFIDTMSKYMLPKDEYEKLGKYDARKEKYFRLIMTQSVAKFTMFAIRSGSSDVVDKQVRSDVEMSKRYIRNWCDQFISIITGERDQLCNLILASRSGIDISKENMDSVPKMVVDKLQEEMQLLINEKTNLEVTVNKYADYANALKKLLEKEQKKTSKLEKSLRRSASGVPGAPNVPGIPSGANGVNTLSTPPAASTATTTVTGSPVSSSPVVKTTDIIGNSIVKDVHSREHKEKVQKSISKLEEEEYSGEDYIKPPEKTTYLEKAGKKSHKPVKEESESSYDDSGESYDSDEVIGSTDESLGSDDELDADE